MLTNVDDGDTKFGKFFFNVVGIKRLDLQNASKYRLQGLQECDQFRGCHLCFVLHSMF